MRLFTRKLSTRDLEILNYLKTHGVHFGSQALGVATRSSDYDFALLYSEVAYFAYTFDLTLKDETPYRGILRGFRRYSFKLSTGTKCDLIVVDPDQLEHYRRTVEYLKYLPRSFLTNKDDRYRIHTSLYDNKLRSLPNYVYSYYQTHHPELFI